MMLEHVSLSLNPRGTLYRDQSLIEITKANGNALAIGSFRRQLDEAEWAIYRVRRIYQPGKDKNGVTNPNKKGVAYRAVEQLIAGLQRETAIEKLRELVAGQDRIVEQRGITYVYRQSALTRIPPGKSFLWHCQRSSRPRLVTVSTGSRISGRAHKEFSFRPSTPPEDC